MVLGAPGRAGVQSEMGQETEILVKNGKNGVILGFFSRFFGAFFADFLGLKMRFGHQAQ